MLAKAAAEPHGQADSEVVGVIEVQLADGASLLASRGVPAALGVSKRMVGWEVLGRVDGPSVAFTARADEEDRAQHPDSSALDLELVPSARPSFGWGRGRAQQQGEIGNEKVVRISDGEGCETGSFTQSRPTP